MPEITYFAVLPFSRTEDGDFLAEAAIEVRSAEQARAAASRMAGVERGAVAFSKTGDPQLGGERRGHPRALWRRAERSRVLHVGEARRPVSGFLRLRAPVPSSPDGEAAQEAA
jgi:hypothetical protein